MNLKFEISIRLRRTEVEQVSAWNSARLRCSVSHVFQYVSSSCLAWRNSKLDLSGNYFRETI